MDSIKHWNMLMRVHTNNRLNKALEYIMESLHTTVDCINHEICYEEFTQTMKWIKQWNILWTFHTQQWVE